jgi:competence protein ComEA
MGSRESYDEALARRLALLRAELTGERAAAETARAREEKERAREERLLDEVDQAESPVDGVTAIRAPGRHASRRFSSGVGARVASRVPAALLGPGPIAVVAVLLALGIGVVAWLSLRSQPHDLPMAMPVAGDLATPVAVPGASTGASPSAARGAAASGAAEVVVHVAGKVRRPGIVVLSPGARVVDALEAAGGARRGVDLSSLNLARPLVDGEQVVVGAPAAAGGQAGGVAASGVDASGKVNLNTASEAQLEELPGVGPVTAAASVALREEQGPFASVDQLLDVSGIGEATLAEIAPHATV